MLQPIVIHNRNKSSIQITAEQLILESVSRMKDRPKLPGLDRDTVMETEDLRFKRRQAWELNVGRNLCSYQTFIRYARWEEDVGDYDRSRSVFERALEFSRFREPDVWNCYIDMELRHKNINRARNLLERAVTILPRYDQFWLRYVELEEKVGNIEGCRHIFQRWISWEPPAHAFLVFAEFESRVKELNKARSVFERLILVHPYSSSYIQYADFEINLRQPGRARNIYERGLETLFHNSIEENLIIKFAEFEECQGEIERSRALYRLALSKLSENHSKDLYSSYFQFEKRYGGQTHIEIAIIEKQKSQYEKILENNPLDYDIWYELSQLYINTNRNNEARDCFIKAFNNLPPLTYEKHEWGRFVLLIISWAIFEEKIMKDIEATRKIYMDLLSKIPHKKFTFSRLWIMYAFFEIRQKNLTFARKIFGMAIGQCPKPAIFEAYIEIEFFLEEFSNVRTLYQKYITLIPSEIKGWVQYAEFEAKQGNIETSRKIFENAIDSNEILDINLLWSLYIDFETKVGNINNVRILLERSRLKNNSLIFWEAEIMLETEVCKDLQKARSLFEKAEESFLDNKLERKKLREFKVSFEKNFGTEESLQEAINKLPIIENNEIIFPDENNIDFKALEQFADNWEFNN